MQTARRTGTVEGGRFAPAKGRPVLLATLEVPFDEAAAALAVDAAIECGEPLIVVVSESYVFLTPVAAAFWLFFVRPFWRRRVLGAARTAPRWELHPD